MWLYHFSRNNYCKFENFRKDVIFVKFRENKTLAKWQNHSVVYLIYMQVNLDLVSKFHFTN